MSEWIAKVLVVDDELDVCHLLKKHLKSQDYQVEIALNVETALEKQLTFRPHVILLDIKMPGMTGLHALQQMKSEDPDVRILMVTAVQDEAVARHAVREGADDYVTKPLDLDYLTTSILVNYIQRVG